MFHYTDACLIEKIRDKDDFNRRMRCYNNSLENEVDLSPYDSSGVYTPPKRDGSGIVPSTRSDINDYPFSQETSIPPTKEYDSSGCPIDRRLPNTGIAYYPFSQETSIPPTKEYDSSGCPIDRRLPNTGIDYGSSPESNAKPDYSLASNSAFPFHMDDSFLRRPKEMDYAHVLEWLKQQKNMTLDIILLTGSILYPEKASAIRDSPVFMMSSKGIDKALKFPSVDDISRFLQGLCSYANHNPDNLDRIELASVFSRGFCLIHPFKDGNGRTSRALANFFLRSREYFKPLPSDRIDYRRACLEVDVSGDPSGMYNYLKKRLITFGSNN